MYDRNVSASGAEHNFFVSGALLVKLQAEVYFFCQYTVISKYVRFTGYFAWYSFFAAFLPIQYQLWILEGYLLRIQRSGFPLNMHAPQVDIEGSVSFRNYPSDDAGIEKAVVRFRL